MNKEYFISGIDTDCGKTYITGHLAYHLAQKNIPVITTKLVQTGCTGIADDIIEHRRIMETGILPEDEALQTCPNIFTFPASPHLAAKIDKKAIQLEKFRKESEKLLEKYRIVLSEGAGGLMVPLTRDWLTIDYIKMYKLPLILVSSSKLGSINHTLMSIAVCFERGIDIKALIYNRLPHGDATIEEDSISIIKKRYISTYPNGKFIDGKELEKTNKSLGNPLDFLLA